ncbi:hypothetical protein AVEN_70345-1, partial [Araneus ventricosus]
MLFVSVNLQCKESGASCHGEFATSSLQVRRVKFAMT